MALRIVYEKSSSSGGAVSIVLDSKQHTEANDHNTFAEEVIMHDDENAMLKFVDEKEYFNWLTIDKIRRYFSSDRPELKVTMDTVSGVRDQLGLDTVLEIEYEGESSREEALALIDSFSAQLGLAPNLLFEKSLTTETMAVLAKFK